MANGWVLFGYLVTYGAITLYALFLVARIRRARRRASDQ